MVIVYPNERICPGVNTLDFVITHTNENRVPGFRTELAGDVSFCDSACVPPYVLQNPVSVIRPPGSTATFSVTAGGTGPLDYQWFHKGNLMQGEDSPALTIGPVGFADSGTYSVLVVNACGQVVSETARLRVLRGLTTVVGQWDFEPSRPLGATVGYDMEYADAHPDDFVRSSEFITVFGSTEDFGLPGIDGRPANVMRISRSGTSLGYLIRAGGEPLHGSRFDWRQLGGPLAVLLLTDGFNEEWLGYVSSIQWHNAMLSDLEIAALGRPSPGGIPPAIGSTG